MYLFFVDQSKKLESHCLKSCISLLLLNIEHGFHFMGNERQILINTNLAAGYRMHWRDKGANGKKRNSNW